MEETLSWVINVVFTISQLLKGGNVKAKFYEQTFSINTNIVYKIQACSKKQILLSSLTFYTMFLEKLIIKRKA